MHNADTAIVDAPGVDNEEQAALRDSVRALLTKKADSAANRAAIDSEHGFDAQLWSTLVEQIGVAALSVPEDYDGVGASYMETHIVVEEVGRSLAPSPLLGSAVLSAHALLASSDSAACSRLLGDIAAGSIASLCWASHAGWDTPGAQATSGGKISGTSHYVLDGHVADTLLVIASTESGVAFFEVAPDAAGVTITRNAVMDPARVLSTVSFDSVAGTPIEIGDSFLDQLLATALTAASAEQLGAMDACLAATVEYTATRKQFGRAIGSFQALKHRMADMYVQVQTSRSICYSAAAAVTDAISTGEWTEALNEARAANVYCSESFQSIASEAIQLHGGVGITWEYDTHLFFKRAHGSAQLFGQPHHVLTTLESSAGL